MPVSDIRHDRLAYRLATVISRLLTGETLYPDILAQEFNISPRTVYRDLHERLIYLDIERHGDGYRLAAPQRLFRTDGDILHFARIMHLEALFPALDRKLLSVLLNTEMASPYIIYHEPPVHTPSLFGGFYAITQAIIQRMCIQFHYGTKHYSRAAPYKLIYLNGCWYLCAEIKNNLHVFDFSRLHDITLTSSDYPFKESVLKQISQPEFITALPHYQYLQSVINPKEL